MYECLYGYTPFACEDRHNTKLKILKHKHTLKFPDCQPVRQPSRDAMDLMQRLLVEKEKRLCSRRYELNDFTKRFVGGQSVKFAADKTSKSYMGMFVYADDAEDLKQHRFFRNIKWESMLDRRPPFVPRVKGWEDTKYFDEEQPISDIDSGSSEDEEPAEEDETIPAPNMQKSPDYGSKASNHHHEDQHIVPSTALKLNGDQIDISKCTKLEVLPPGLPARQVEAAKDADEIVDAEKVEGEPLPSPPTKKKREKKRPRCKILRDPECGKTAMKLRENGAFLGYAYARPKGVEEVVAQVVVDEAWDGPSSVGDFGNPGLGGMMLPRDEIC
jgi:hypothetical protein